MIRDDYILRLIKQIADFVARIARKREEGRFEDALSEADRAWSELFEVPRGLRDAVDSPTLASLLRDPDRMRAAARLFREEGLIHAASGDPPGAAMKYRRAFELFLEARAIEPTEADDAAVLELSGMVPASELDARYREAAGSGQ